VSIDNREEFKIIGTCVRGQMAWLINVVPSRRLDTTIGEVQHSSPKSGNVAAKLDHRLHEQANSAEIFR
jgi:hypothetical protein